MAHVLWPHGGTELTVKNTATENGAKTTCRIINAASDVDAMVAVDAAKPATVTVGGKVLVFDELKLKHVEAGVYDADLSYVHPDKQDNKEDAENESPTISFDTTGGQKHITHSYETVRAYGAETSKHSQAIGVTKTAKGEIKILGTDVVIPACKGTVSAKIPQPTDPFEFARNLSRRTGRTNRSTWNGFTKWELLYCGGKLTGKKREKWTIDLQFEFSETIEAEDNLTIGPFTNIVKEGFAHLWIEWKQGFTGGTGNEQSTAIVEAVFIEKIYFDFELSELGL